MSNPIIISDDTKTPTILETPRCAIIAIPDGTLVLQAAQKDLRGKAREESTSEGVL
jgi:hypothetical protein